MMTRWRRSSIRKAISVVDFSASISPSKRGPKPAHTAAGSHAGHNHGPGGHTHPPAQPAAKEVPGIPGVEHIIAVASGKGGVGKSTTAVNLALGVRDQGLKVGMLDADIYGPSLPKLFNIREKPEAVGGTRLKPIERYGLKIMSIGFLIDEETPMIWRGPMVISAITQMPYGRMVQGQGMEDVMRDVV